MLPRAALAATAITLSYLGAARGTAVGSPNGGPGAHAPAPGGMQQGVIHDPGLNMDAFTVPYPAKWHFQGTVLQGTACSNIPMAVYRVFSPDGLSEIERMPRLDWKWGTMGNGPVGQPPGCLPFDRVLTGKELLQYLSAILKVEYVSDLPVAPAKVATYQQALASAPQGPAGNGMKRFPDVGELASALVRYKNKSFTIEGRIDAQIRCQHTQMGPANKVWDIHVCWANVKYTHAPEDQFKTVTTEYTDAVTESIDQQWFSTYLQQQARAGQAMLDANMRKNNAQLQAQYEQFQQGQAMRQRESDEFNATLKRGTQMSMQQAAQIANSDHTIASDYVDYSLDRQTVRDPNTGQVSKVSSSLSYTWLDESGKVAYQTSDVNANPNGSLKGTWTRQQVVHGDGSD